MFYTCDMHLCKVVNKLMHVKDSEMHNVLDTIVHVCTCSMNIPIIFVYVQYMHDYIYTNAWVHLICNNNYFVHMTNMYMYHGMYMYNLAIIHCTLFILGEGPSR